ncbi:MAG: hypothetical protein H6555_09730 [Lewinellaceae bacterium]|nr:hypothetical protein [Lewinellaceae bacterium]
MKSKSVSLLLVFSVFAMLLTTQCTNTQSPSPVAVEPSREILTRIDTLIVRDTIVIRDTIRQSVEPIGVKTEKMNVLYIGVDNPLTVTPRDARISGSGAGIKLRGEQGSYLATVGQPGEARINVQTDSQTASFTYRVKRIPDPVARLAKSTGGQIGSGEFKAQGGLGAFLDNFDFDATCQVTGFNLVYVPKRQDPVESVNTSARYNEKSRQLINVAKPGDIYYFDNVKARCPGDPAGRTINSLVFNIK